MPVNTRAYPSAAFDTQQRGVSRHRVDRQDELCLDVTQDERWVTVEIHRRPGLRVVLECGGRRVSVEADCGREDVPSWALGVLEFLNLDDVYKES